MDHRQYGQTRQNGAIAVIVAVSIAVLVGFAGLAADLGQLFVSKTELQDASDACALAASAALTGVNANQLAIAESWGTIAGEANRMGFQKVSVTVTPNQDVTFSDTLNGTYVPKDDPSATANPLKMKFAKCTLKRTGIKTWFIQALNVIPGVAIGDQQVQSMGVATLQPSQTNCALPFAICADGSVALNKGNWLTAVLDAQSNITGNFQWVTFSNTSSGKEIKDILTGAGVCNLPATGAQVGATGGKGGETAAWNTRFGIYAGSYKGPTDGVPDFTGFAYTPTSWPEQSNAYAGTSTSGNSNFQGARDNYSPYQGDTASGVKTNGSVAGQDAYKEGSDRRLGIVPVVNCADFGGGSTKAKIQSYACVLMLAPMQQGNGSGGNGNNASIENLPSTTVVASGTSGAFSVSILRVASTNGNGNGNGGTTGGGSSGGTTGGGSSGGGNSGGSTSKAYIEYLGAANDPASPCATIGLPGSSNSVGPMVPALVQ